MYALLLMSFSMILALPLWFFHAETEQKARTARARSIAAAMIQMSDAYYAQCKVPDRPNLASFYRRDRYPGTTTSCTSGKSIGAYVPNVKHYDSARTHEVYRMCSIFETSCSGVIHKPSYPLASLDAQLNRYLMASGDEYAPILLLVRGDTYYQPSAPAPSMNYVVYIARPDLLKGVTQGEVAAQLILMTKGKPGAGIFDSSTGTAIGISPTRALGPDVVPCTNYHATIPIGFKCDSHSNPHAPVLRHNMLAGSADYKQYIDGGGVAGFGAQSYYAGSRGMRFHVLQDGDVVYIRNLYPES